ncbi:hypothetical protein [Gordonia rhizosphera]|uniref:Uncharacterized protein n=1 Tax=Gordonia rhizosphera NBRC 16068 TaxID=1108045 RepID=K6W9N3_9ACTN|nr:hypothetical protein [Gordonia rhizosphera]GAB88917.1 hypothetical protein GORHZ_046_00670 [Gordonia rhizosphera NBRC 16068]
MSRGILVDRACGPIDAAAGTAAPQTNTRFGRRGLVGAGLAGVAMAGALAMTAPSASAGVQAVNPLAASVIQVENVARTVGAPFVAPVAGSAPMVASPIAALPGADFGRHTVATPQQIGTSTAVGAGIGAVVGFGVGLLAGPVLAPVVAPATAVVCGALLAAPGVGPGLSAACGLAIPLTVATGGALVLVGAPLVGAAVGAGIGAAIGAGIGSTYASQQVPLAAPLPETPVAAPAVETPVWTPPVIPAPVIPEPVMAAAQPTIDNIARAVDRAVETSPELGRANDLIRSVLPGM